MASEASDRETAGHAWSRPLDPADKEGERPTIFLPSGKKYKGEWSRNKMNGRGTMTYVNGDKYEGEWLDNKRHGFGTYWKHEHGRYRVEYNGTHVHGRREGFGVFFNDQGERYEGEWLNSKRHGRGRQTIGGRFDGVGADVYEGDWVMDRKTGRGVMQYANGDCYSGGWVDDEKHGEGTHFYEEKQTRYDGVWERGTPRCGTYATMEDGDMPQVLLPRLGLLRPDEVDEAARAERMKSVAC